MFCLVELLSEADLLVYCDSQLARRPAETSAKLFYHAFVLLEALLQEKDLLELIHLRELCFGLFSTQPFSLSAQFCILDCELTPFLLLGHIHLVGLKVEWLRKVSVLSYLTLENAACH